MKFLTIESTKSLNMKHKNSSVRKRSTNVNICKCSKSFEDGQERVKDKAHSRRSKH